MVSRSPQKSFQMNSEQVETVKHIADGAAIVVAGASLVGLLPAIAALLTIVWTSIRIYETDTAKRFFTWLSNRH